MSILDALFARDMVDIDGRSRLDGTGLLAVQAENGAQEHRLAGAGCTDKPKDFAAPHVQREFVQNHLVAKGDSDVHAPTCTDFASGDARAGPPAP
jgi:hypothetical protein